MNLQTHENGKVVVAVLEGRFDSYGVPAIVRWLDGVTSAPPARVVIDMTAVTFIDSTALAALVRGMKRARERGGDLRLCGLCKTVRIIFELTRLDRVFDILANEDAAVRAFGS